MPDPQPIIRQARRDDARVMADLVSDLGYVTTPEAMGRRLDTLLSDGNYAAFVAELSGAVVGVAGGVVEHRFEKDGLNARLLVISVSTASRGRGIGRLLVHAVEEWARARGASEIVVHSGKHRVDAHRFYEREGYGGIGFRFVKPLA
jgi:GNAT superfamily N-acetyltransferase